MTANFADFQLRICYCTCFARITEINEAMAEDEQSVSTRKSVRSVFLKSALGVTLLAAIMASAIAWRVSGRVGAPGFLSIFVWQLAIWAPWVAYFFASKYVTNQIRTDQNVAVVGFALHISAALLIAISHLAWYWQLSSHFSPLIGMQFTRFGVYQFFFIFWFLIDALIYSAIVIAQSNAKSNFKETVTSGHAKQYVVRKGRAQHIVRTEDINWIEAQGYYAGLHTSNGLFLIRKSLNALEKELDPDQFIRVHRSTIVNIGQINKVQSAPSGATTISLDQGGDRNVSREGRRRLREFLNSRT
jgi:hypothetical protein